MEGALTKGMTSMRGRITSLDVCMDFWREISSLFFFFFESLHLRIPMILQLMHHSETFWKSKWGYTTRDDQSLFLRSSFNHLLIHLTHFKKKTIRTGPATLQGSWYVEAIIKKHADVISYRNCDSWRSCAGHNRRAKSLHLGWSWFWKGVPPLRLMPERFRNPLVSANSIPSLVV